MKLWSMESSETLGLFLSQLEIYGELNGKGINTSQVRQVFTKTYGEFGPTFDLLRNGKIYSGPNLSMPDLMFWNWVPVFSKHALESIAFEVGSEADFLQCHFRGAVQNTGYLHLPFDASDVVDFKRSIFSMLIPMPHPQEPLPHRIEKLVTNKSVDITKLPNCFRALNRHDQTFGELIVSDKLKEVWCDLGLSGAKFRLLD
jgi:hypothetical protein